MKGLSICCLLLVLVLSACSSTPQNEPAKEPRQVSINQCMDAPCWPEEPPPPPPPPPMYSKQISAGHGHTCGTNSSGKAYCWGNNLNGQLGNGVGGPNIKSSTPQAVVMPAGVSFTRISAGQSFTCALGSNSKAYCWGFGGDGQLGNGSYNKNIIPVAVSMPAGVSFTQISAGSFHTCALGIDKKAYCWGLNAHGQLGNGTYDESNLPAAVSMPAGVSFTQIGVGYTNTCALGTNSKAYCWGDNENGQLGNGTNNDSNTPVAVSMPAGVGVTQIDAGHQHTCSLGSNSKTYCWGQNVYGQLGNGVGGLNNKSSTPQAVAIPAGVSFTKISAGEGHTCALGTNSKTYCWGDNEDGELGSGNTNNSNIPIAVNTPSGISFTQVSAGWNHTCALASTSKTHCWGSNGSGELGNGFGGLDSDIPVPSNPY